jgi:hypothetical protein
MDVLFGLRGEKPGCFPATGINRVGMILRARISGLSARLSQCRAQGNSRPDWDPFTTSTLHVLQWCQCDDFFTMWAGDSLPDGVGGKFNVFPAKKAGHFQVFRLAQCDIGVTVRAGDFLAKVSGVKPQMDTT